MAISTGGNVTETPMSDINTTPLVDVMLVLLIIFLIAIPVAIQTIEKLKLPVMKSVESKDKVENLLLTVSTSDDGGRSAGEPGFTGASRNGECRVYFNNTTAVDFAGTLRPGVRTSRFDRPGRRWPRGTDEESRGHPAGPHPR